MIPLSPQHRQNATPTSSNSAGFTLLEMLVVLALIALTATASILSMGSKPGQEPLLLVVTLSIGAEL